MRSQIFSCCLLIYCKFIVGEKKKRNYLPNSPIEAIHSTSLVGNSLDSLLTNYDGLKIFKYVNETPCSVSAKHTQFIDLIVRRKTEWFSLKILRLKPDGLKIKNNSKGTERRM